MHLDVRPTLAERFQRRAVELARRGTLGKSLRTCVPALREAYVQWVGLLDAPEISLLLYGEKGTGKRKHVEEYLYLHNLHGSLQQRPQGKLRVFRGDFVAEGFSRLLSGPEAHAEDLIYLEAVDLLSAAGQVELLEHLRLRKEWARQDIRLPRLLVGTDRALSLLVLQGAFSRELFQQLGSFSVFLPSLPERALDLPHMMAEFLRELSGKPQIPPVWLVDLLSGRPLSGNWDELKSLLRNLLARQSDPSLWTREDLNTGLPRPSTFTVGIAATLSPGGSHEVSERRRILKALGFCDGDLSRSAQSLGLARGELLRKMMAYGLRVQ